jgi:Lipoprotein LpqB beta-propeller domain/Sporulation and spore germination
VSGRGCLAALVAAALALAGCSTVPTSSPTVPITQVPTRQEPDVGIEPLAPEAGASPEEIVRGFIDASASTGRGHPVAREYLTPAGQDSWADDGGVTVIEPGFATVTRDEGVIRLSARTVGTVDERGIFTVGGERFVRDFAVEQVGEEWRIAQPEDGLIVLEPDFERVYDQLNAYFLDPTGERVVPDPRYLVVGEAQPTALVQRLFEGPSPTLRAGVDNPLQGLSLRRPVSVEGSTATVDLTGLPADPEPPLRQICAQLVWTLGQSRIRGVEVLVEGEAVSLPQVPRVQTTDDWAAYDPGAVPVDAVGHYVDDAGALRTAPDGQPAPGPAGEGAYDMVSAAAASDPTSGELSFLAAVTAADGEGERSLLAGPYGGELAAVLPGSRSLTAPTVAATRPEIWTVRNGNAVVRVLPGATPQNVTESALAGLGTVEALQLSPDGVRAALLVDGRSGPVLYLGIVVRSEGGEVALGDLREVNPAIEDPVDVTWLAGDTLMLLADNPAGDAVVPYEVGVDGWGLTEVPTSGLPADPATIAAAPDQEPLVSAGAPDGETAPTIWRLIGVTWVTLVVGAPPQPGTEPFYPL